jgi:hypothetical protein
MTGTGDKDSVNTLLFFDNTLLTVNNKKMSH